MKKRNSIDAKRVLLLKRGEERRRAIVRFLANTTGLIDLFPIKTTRE